MKRQTKRSSVFGQMILLLSAALITLMVMLCVILLRLRSRQAQADQEYFRIETQNSVQRIAGHMQDLKVVTAQLSENKLLQAFLEEPNTLERWRYSQYVRGVLSILLSNNSQIQSVDMYWLDGRRYTNTDTDWYLSKSVQEIANVEDPQDTEVRFLLLRPQKSSKYTRFAYVSPIYSLKSGEKLATLALFGTCERLLSGGASDYVDVYLMDAWGNYYPDAPTAPLENWTPLSYDAQVSFVQTSAYVDASQAQYVAMLIALALVMVLTLLLVGMFLTRQLTHPVLMISRQMELVKSGEKSSVQIASGGMELVSLCDGINDMLATIQKLYQENMQVSDQRYQAELARVEAQLYALRNQINPHFLYNTLQTVRGMAMYHGIPEIGRIATNMAYIFRYAVKETPMAEAREEMAAARRFVEIMNVRMNERFDYSDYLEPALEHSMVPKMIVQPIIENAMKYAFNGMDEGARITLKWYREGEDILVVLEDNGCGMTEAALSALIRKMQEPFSTASDRESGGLGLRNIHQRLRLRYGKGYGVCVESKVGAGTRVTLSMPADADETV